MCYSCSDGISRVNDDDNGSLTILSNWDGNYGSVISESTRWPADLSEINSCDQEVNY